MVSIHQEREQNSAKASGVEARHGRAGVLKLYLRGASTAGDAAPRPDRGGGGRDARIRRDRRGGVAQPTQWEWGFASSADAAVWRDAGGGRGPSSSPVL